MHLFLDVDGVLLDFERSFVGFLNRHRTPALPPGYQAESWNFEEVLRPDEIERYWHAYLESEDAEALEPLLAPGEFNALAKRFPVHLLTNFPRPHAQKRRSNLDKLGLAYHSLSFCGLHAFQGDQPQSKSAAISGLLRETGPALFVDDHPDNCLDVARNCPGVEVWLMDRRFNRAFSHDSIHRAAGWDALLNRMRSVSGGW